MPDRKFEREIDRQVILDDFKKRLIDLMENKQPLPDVGIYDEPVRYFKANEQWCAVIFGWLDWLEDIAGWQDAEDENYQGIQAILTFEEGITLEPIDYDLLETAISSGMYRFANDVAKQIVSGRTKNIAVGDDGTVTDPTTSGGAELPEDDPTTEVDETEAYRYGGILEIVSKLELLLDRVDIYYGGVNGFPAQPLAVAQERIKSYFQCDPALMDEAVNSYYTYRTDNVQLSFNRTTAFPLYLYCNGYSIAAINRWLVDKSGFNDLKRGVVATLWESLSEEFFSYYFGIGSKVQSNAYLDADCIPVAFQEFLNVPFGSNRQTTNMKSFHRLKIKISGLSTDTDGDIQDAFWYVTAAGVRTRQNPTFQHFVTSLAGNISDNQVVYNASHIYEFTLDLSNATNSPLVITMNKNGGMSGSASNPNFEIEVTDLGQGADT